MQYPADDTDFTERTIDSVVSEPDGTHSITIDGWTLWCGKKCAVKPEIGQIARRYSKGLGYSVRGLFIDGRQLWYRTEAEEKEQQEIERYGADAADWLKRWDEGRGVWSIEMGGLGPGYEQCIQITCAEMVRWFIDNLCNSSSWSDPEIWKRDSDAIDEQLLDGTGVVNSLGLSGAQWGAALSLASCIYRDGPRKVMSDDRVKDRQIQVSKNFPGCRAA